MYQGIEKSELNKHFIYVNLEKGLAFFFSMEESINVNERVLKRNVAQARLHVKFWSNKCEQKI